MEKFKIFYSWQSDLPGSRTRNFIRECIDDAIDLAQESETIEAERDEATIGTTGSPNIVTTLFSKIDNSDLFIADLSLCFSENQKGEKKSPNPNVLLELGYAVKTLGWERVICLCNTEYGDDYPFDIAHNRITNYTLVGKSKKEVKADIARIIFINIRDIRKQPMRVKEGAATHIIGSYDVKSHKVTNSLVSVEVDKQEKYVLYNEKLLKEANILFAEIQELNRQIKLRKELNRSRTILPEQSMPNTTNRNLLSPTVHAFAESLKASETPVVWDHVEEDKELIGKWLHIEVPDEFFDMGGLKKIVLLSKTPNLNGTDDEKDKYEKLIKLGYKLRSLDIRSNYINTFAGMFFIPLAIQNISTMYDSDIRVVVYIDVGEIVEPNENLIHEEYQGLQKYLCRNDDDKKDMGIIAELFSLQEDGVIQIENMPYDPILYSPKMPIFNGRGEVSYPEKTKEDYKQELSEFIASSAGSGFYEFNVKNLRPGECRWLCRGMLVRSDNGEVRIHYQIHSERSRGNLNGTLEMRSSLREV